jgi:class 3 adenylate cyclase
MGVPGGTVTLFFTDMEGSTELAERLPSAWPAVLADHRRLLTDAIVSNSGREIDSRGEEVFAVFESARSAVKAALAAQRAHARHPWPAGAQVRVRIGIHTGEPTVGDTGYLGLEVHRAARICGLAHGGQILLTRPTRELVFEQPAEDLGEIALKGLSRPEQVFQLVALTCLATSHLFAPITFRSRNRVIDSSRTLFESAWTVRRRCACAG